MLNMGPSRIGNTSNGYFNIIQLLLEFVNYYFKKQVKITILRVFNKHI